MSVFLPRTELSNCNGLLLEFFSLKAGQQLVERNPDISSKYSLCQDGNERFEQLHFFVVLKSS